MWTGIRNSLDNREGVVLSAIITVTLGHVTYIILHLVYAVGVMSGGRAEHVAFEG